MSRKLKALGLALVAVFAMGALSAASASAASFHSEAEHTILSGEQHSTEDTFTVNAGTVRCSHATYAGTESSATSGTQTVTPTYTGCRAFGFVNTTIDTNGCGYVFDITAGATGGVTIECPTVNGVEQKITVTAFNCWVTVGHQPLATGVSYTNQGSGSTRDVTVDVNLSGIKYTQHSKSFPGCGNGTFTNGTYAGAATVKGADTSGTQVGVWVS